MNPLLKLILNKYFLTFTAFLVWMVFFDNNNLRRQRQLGEELGELYKTRQFYITETSKNRDLIFKLQNDKETIERIAREKYLMKRDSEDVFVVVRD